MTRTSTRTPVSSSEVEQLIAARIRQAQLEARDGEGIRNEELARELGVTLRLVQKWRAGENAPSQKNLMKLARYFGREISWFFTRETEAA